MRKYFFAIFFFLGLFHVQSISAQVVSDTASEEENETVDPDYKPLTKAGNTVRGKWYGIGNVVVSRGYSNSYLCELLLKEDAKGAVTGYFNYFFRDGYFSNKLYGTYDRSKQVFKFKPVIVLFHQTVKANIGVDVPMYGNFILNLNSKDTTLTGFMTPVNNYKYLVPAINVKLSITSKSDPTLKERIRRRKLELEEDEDVAKVLKEQTASSVESDSSHSYKKDNVNVSKGKDALNSATTDPKKIVYAQDTIKARPVIEKYRDTLHLDDLHRNYSRDSLRLTEHKIISEDNRVKINDQLLTMQQQIAEAYHHRQTTVANNSLVVMDDSVKVTLYDNGEYDHDVVSVFFNGKLIANNVELKTNVPSSFVIHLDKTAGAKNELTLFAENLGTLPPNSALMIIEDYHNTRHEVNLKSDLSHNVSVFLVPKL